MKVGVTLPQFRDDAGTALAAATAAEAAGLDGVFCFDHLWPMGRPDRPALSMAPLLGAVAASTSTIGIGTLVARIGLVPDDVLVAVLSTLAELSHGRLIAGIGTGDAKSRAENEAFGVEFDHVAVRHEHLVDVATTVASAGIEVWIGGGRPSTNGLARELGCAVNLWEGSPARVRELVVEGFDVTWGGPVTGGVRAMADQLVELAGAGASHAVCAWPGSLAALSEAAEVARRG